MPEEGFEYPLHEARVQTDRIQLGIDPGDLLCGLVYAADTESPSVVRATVTAGNLSYGCLPNLGFTYSSGSCALNEADGTSVPVDCGKLTLCTIEMACTCTSTACDGVSVPQGTLVNQYPVQIDGALDSTGSTLTGTLALPNSTRVTVVLQKQ